MEYGHRLVLTGIQAKRKFAGTVFIAEGQAAGGDEVRVPDEQAASIKGRRGGGRNRKAPRFLVLSILIPVRPKVRSGIFFTRTMCTTDNLI